MLFNCDVFVRDLAHDHIVFNVKEIHNIFVFRKNAYIAFFESYLDKDQGKMLWEFFVSFWLSLIREFGIYKSILRERGIKLWNIKTCENIFVAEWTHVRAGRTSAELSFRTTLYKIFQNLQSFNCESKNIKWYLFKFKDIGGIFIVFQSYWCKNGFKIKFMIRKSVR